MASVPIPRHQKHIILLGSGVTSLSISLALHSSKATSSFKQTIIATEVPGDYSIDYTSPWAGGHWRSFASTADSVEEERIRKWDKRTYEVWMEKLENDDLDEKVINDIGLGTRESRNYWAHETPETASDGSGLWWSLKPNLEAADTTGLPRWGVKDFEVLDLDSERHKAEENVPDGAIFGVTYKTVCIDIPTHLSYLFRNVKDQGTKIIKDTVNTAGGLGAAVKDAKRILLSHIPGVKEEDVFAVINCTGLGARHFVESQEATKLFPVRGQTILVKGESSKARTFVGFGEGTEEEELLYVIPRPGSGTTILGGCKQKGNWSADVDEKLNEKILERVKKWGLAEELRTGKSKEFEVLSYQVGLRPGRQGGPRVEVDKGGKIDGLWVLHSYGHSGGGYQCSVGCAEKITELVATLAMDTSA